jgi:hypothetical protein
MAVLNSANLSDGNMHKIPGAVSDEEVMRRVWTGYENSRERKHAKCGIRAQMDLGKQ